jgi:predicted Kef-type K+ transport protein
MEFSLLAIALGDVTWILLAFVFGLLARAVGLPPLIGYLVTGFLLHAQGAVPGDVLEKLSDLGVTLLLFSIGLKLNLRTLARPEVWAVTGIHMVIVCGVFGLGLFVLAWAGVGAFAGLDLATSFLVAFALSFSSTVFVVKILEQRGEMASLHGRTAIGVLVVQDVLAVGFIAVSTAKLPSAWALLVIAALFPLRPVLMRLLKIVGHGELLVLYGLVLALGGAELFELIGIKGDVGALIMGVLLASHAKSDELNKTMLGFKDLFLLGFFLSVGLSGTPALESFLVAALLVPLVIFKSALFFFLFTRFRLRARTSLFASIDLGNFSEFGLIVASLAASQGWISFDWLVVIAIALAFSFVLASVVNGYSYALHDRFREHLRRFQSDLRLPYDEAIEIGGARFLVIGMGGVGTGAFAYMDEIFPGQVLGVDTDLDRVRTNAEAGRNVIRGDPSDIDFWDRVNAAHCVQLVMLALPKVSTSLAVIQQLRKSGYQGQIAAIARYPDEVSALEASGADSVFNIYSQAGSGFASQVIDHIRP